MKVEVEITKLNTTDVIVTSPMVCDDPFATPGSVHIG